MNLPIIAKRTQAELSKIQKSFNQKIKKIDELKVQIALIENHEMLLRKKIAKSFDPLIKECNQVRIAFAEKLDAHSFDKRFTKIEKKKLSAVICQYISVVLEAEESEKAIELYNRHNNGRTFEEEQVEAEEAQKEFLKKQAEMFGFNFSDKDFEDPEAFITSAMEQAEKIEAENKEKQVNRKKTPKQLEKEQKEAEQTKMLAKTTKALYMDLAKILHPDLEHNDTKKQEKTELMHLVTAAYEKNDIFTLLNLHIRYAQEGENKLDVIAEEQIKLYIVHLNEQIRDLNNQILAKRFHNFSPLMEFAGLKTFEKNIQQKEKQIKKELESLQEILWEADDIKIVKQRLKHTDLEEDDEFDIDINLLLDMMSQMGDIFDKPKKSRKKK